MKDDGFYIPKEPEVYKRWYENATFDSEAFWQERQDSILSEDQLVKYRETKTIVTNMAKLLKVPTDKIVEKIQKIQSEIESVK